MNKHIRVSLIALLILIAFTVVSCDMLGLDPNIMTDEEKAQFIFETGTYWMLDILLDNEEAEGPVLENTTLNVTQGRLDEIFSTYDGEDGDLELDFTYIKDGTTIEITFDGSGNDISDFNKISFTVRGPAVPGGTVVFSIIPVEGEEEFTVVFNGAPFEFDGSIFD